MNNPGKRDLVYARINRDITNPFVPNYLSFMRRKLQIRPVAGQRNHFEFRFVESTLLGDTIEKGDWVIVGNFLCKVIKVSGKNIVLEYDDDSIKNEAIRASVDDNVDKWAEIVYYKNLDPCTYYLQMLGIYLYHIFFVGLGSATKDKPLRITIAQSARYLSNIEKPIKFKEIKINENKKNIDIKDIYYFIINIYLNLTFINHEQSYYVKESEDKGKISAVLDDARKLQILIAQLINVRAADLDRLDRGVQAYKAKLPELLPDDIDFDTLIRTFVDVSFKTVPIPKWKLLMKKGEVKLIEITKTVYNKTKKIDYNKILKKFKISIKFKKQNSDSK